MMGLFVIHEKETFEEYVKCATGNLELFKENPKCTYLVDLAQIYFDKAKAMTQ